MASQSLPIQVPQTKSWMRAGARAVNRVLPLWTIVAILAALLILFGWLHLILALQVAATNRTIQERTLELEAIERDQSTIVLEMAEAKSPQSLEARALRGEFEAHRPLYLILPQDPVETGPGTDPEAGASSDASTSSAASAGRGSTLLEAVVTEADRPARSESTP